LAAFSTHINAAVLSSGVVILPLYSSGVISSNAAFTLLFLALLGGVLPDIDSDTSKPVQISFRFISIVLPLLFLLLLAKQVSFLYIVLFWALAYLSLHIVFFKLFLPVTKHRGIFHSVPMGVVVGLIGFIILHDLLELNRSYATLGGFFLFYGYITHLLLDEIYSVNALGLRLKKSFGSALKLWGRDNLIGYVFVYILCGVLLYTLPLDFSILTKVFTTIKGIKLV